MKATIFKNFATPVEDKSLIVIINDIIKGKYKTEVDHIRSLIAAGDNDEAAEMKNQLMAFTPSAIFSGGIKQACLVEYSGHIALDVDNLTVAEYTYAFAQAKFSPYTFCCFRSPSGNGIKIIIEVTSTQEHHGDAYKQLVDYYEPLINVKIDRKCKNLNRLCFVSYDPDGYKNINNVKFPVVVTESKKEDKITDEQIKSGDSTDGNPEKYTKQFQSCIELTERLHSFKNGERNNFVHQLGCNCNRAGIPMDIAMKLTKEQFNIKGLNATIKSAYSHKEEHNTIKAHDIKSETTNIDKIENFLSERYGFRKNVVTGKIEFRELGGIVFEPITDYKENSFLRELLKAHIKCNLSILRAILGSDFCKEHNPFIEYFNSLPKWDGVTDHINELASTIITTQQKDWEICFKKWIVAMVGTAIDDKTINHTVIVFSGKQGIGKTSWIENLVPPALKDYLYSGSINPDNKDTLINLAECFLINLDELENLNRSEIGSLKEIITKTCVRLRRSYGHNNESMTRRASFAGSVNTAQFLNDTTGSRRFLAFEVTTIDYKHTVDLSLVFSQALHLFKTGFVFWFNKEEIKKINENNEQYQMRSVEEELLLTWFEKPIENFNTEYLSTSEIASKISVHTKINITGSTINLLGKALHKHGYERIKRGGRYVYTVREKTVNEVNSVSNTNTIKQYSEFSL